MSLFIVRFTDKPDTLTLRQALRPSHLEFLDAHKDMILVGGALTPEADAPPVGACWIMDAASREDAEALLKTDPFWTGGLRAGYEILYWKKAFPDRRVPV